MSKKLDLTDHVYGRLRVVSEYGDGYWNCVCECGNRVAVSRNALRSSHTRSCGCLHNERAGRGPRKVKPYDDYVASLVNCHYRNSAKKRGLEFLLTKEDVKGLIFSPCFYCGTEGSNEYYHHQRKSKGGESKSYNGIDRVDNSIGYTLENCVPCCVNCNRAKREQPVSDFLSWLDQVASFRRNIVNG